MDSYGNRLQNSVSGTTTTVCTHVNVATTDMSTVHNSDWNIFHLHVHVPY